MNSAFEYQRGAGGADYPHQKATQGESRADDGAAPDSAGQEVTPRPAVPADLYAAFTRSRSEMNQAFIWWVQSKPDEELLELEVFATHSVINQLAKLR